jgi:predicted DNA-binding transcriptional regulator AlpA
MTTIEVPVPTDGTTYTPAMDTKPKRVGTADPVGALEIANRLGLQRQTVAVWRRRHPDFPQPRWVISGLPAWDWSDIEPWLLHTGRRRHELSA